MQDYDVQPNWAHSNLLSFPNAESNLKRERRKHRQSFNDLCREAQLRKLRDDEETVKRLDIEMNMERLMFQDKRYRGLCQRKPFISSVFGKIMMNRIIYDAQMIERYKDNAELQERFKSRVEERIMTYFPSQTRECDRYVKNHFKFDRKKYMRKRVYGDEEEVSPQSDEQIEPNEEVNKTDTVDNEDFKLPSIFKPSESVHANRSETEHESAFPDNRERRQNSKEKSYALKPKNQVATLAVIKLPKIH
jgi:hypothetical protein